MRKAFLLLASSILALGLAACGKKEETGAAAAVDPNKIAIGVSSESGVFADAFKAFGAKNGVTVTVVAKGSLDLGHDLAAGQNMPHDIVLFPAKTIIDAKDTQKVVKGIASDFMHSPVIPLVERSRAEGLGWVGGKKEFTWGDFFTAVKANKVTYAMASPTQSFAGQAAFLGFSNYIAGSPEMLTVEHLASPKYNAESKAVYAKLKKTATSTSALRDYIVAHPGEVGALVSYESTAHEMNRALQAANSSERYCALIPAEGAVIADYPVGYVDKGSAKKKEFYDKFVAYLRSEEFARIAHAEGRRTGFALQGNVQSSGDPCFDTARKVREIMQPRAEVAQQALALYQESLRKPSRIIVVADRSPSMDENGGRVQLFRSVDMLFSPGEASKWGLQPTGRDVTIYVPFGGRIGTVLRVDGNDQGALAKFVASIKAQPSIGSTELYTGLAAAVEVIEKEFPPSDDYFTAIIALTDGDSGDNDLKRAMEGVKRLAAKGIPTYAVAFGSPNFKQLNEVANAQQANGDKWLVIDGRSDLTTALRKVRGMN